MVKDTLISHHPKVASNYINTLLIPLRKVDILHFTGFINLIEPVYFLGDCWYRANISVGASEERLMLSGLHMVADIFCCSCGQIVGWKYVISLSISLSHCEHM